MLTQGAELSTPFQDAFAGGLRRIGIEIVLTDDCVCAAYRQSKTVIVLPGEAFIRINAAVPHTRGTVVPRQRVVTTLAGEQQSATPFANA